MSFHIYKKSKFDFDCCKLPTKYAVTIKLDNGKMGTVILSKEEIEKLQEKIEIREVFS